MQGWIKIHRSIRKHWIHEKPEYYAAFIDIIMEVNHEEKSILIGSSLMTCERGSSLNSIEGWARIFGKSWTRQKVRTFFKLLQQDKIIEIKNIKKTTKLSVCNYCRYQGSQPDDNHLLTTKKPDDNQMITTNKNDKNVKNENNKIKNNNIFIIPNIDEIKSYCLERKNNVNAEQFWDFYNSKGWLVGKNKMKDWKSAVRNWERNKLSTGYPQAVDKSGKSYHDRINSIENEYNLGYIDLETKKRKIAATTKEYKDRG